jgi:hypothetical protein
MAHGITKPQYDEIKDDYSYSVVAFKNGRRCVTISGCTMLRAVKDIMEQQSYGCETLLIKNLPLFECAWEREAYNKYVLKGGQ